MSSLSSSGPLWRFWIDVGGTFTDCIGVDPDGIRYRSKVLSSGVIRGSFDQVSADSTKTDGTRIGEPDDLWRGYQATFFNELGQVIGKGEVSRFTGRTGEFQFDIVEGDRTASTYELTGDEPAPILAMRNLLGLALGSDLPTVDVRLGTTRGTNALLTRQGARTAFLTTGGFRDLVAIGDQSRRDLFALNIKKPLPLCERVLTIAARHAADGEELQAVDETRVKEALSSLAEQGIESLAICLMHADRYPAHEQLIARLAAKCSFANVSLSHRVSPLIKLIPRAQTTILDAYLNPVLGDYVEQIKCKLGEGSRLQLMTSSGGLVAADKFSGKDCLLSGPAGGVVGFARTAQAAGFEKAIGFDMGGTSTDVSRFEGRFEREYESEKAGVPISAPQLAIETVAAGGGSICHFDGTRLLVGPQSASSRPGPACYGAGGPLAITDINLFLGRIRPEHFPWKLDIQAVHSRLDEVCGSVEEATGARMSREEVALGFLKIANLSMATAIRSISVARGYDPREYVLCAFGGAAGQHACAVADELGIPKVLIHPDAGVLSALGMGLAEVERHAAAGINRPLEELSDQWCRSEFDRLQEEGTIEVMGEGFRRDSIQHRCKVELRYVGTDSTLILPAASLSELQQSFQREHQRRYGYVQSRSLELVTLRVETVGVGSKVSTVPAAEEDAEVGDYRENDISLVPFWSGGKLQEADVWQRSLLRSNATINGPALICEPHSTTIVESGWEAKRLVDGQLLLTRMASEPVLSSDERHSATSVDEKVGATLRFGQEEEQADPIQLELFNKHFQSIAREMGETLRQTAVSVNVKERLDFSCALFSASGDLVANAPHIPVHLGAMSESVKSLLTPSIVLSPGDVFVTNDPFAGGSHLPDITAITPVFDLDSRELVFFTASRAHHAELGGKTPGSMPADSTSLAEEGVLLSNFALIKNEEPKWEELERLLKTAQYPSRNPAENLADIRAQVAANQKGVAGLQSLADRYSITRVQAYMRHIQQAALRKVKVRAAELPIGRRTWKDHLDDGSVIQVTLIREEDRIEFDFSGSSDVHEKNLNANRSIVQAALMYVLRVWLDEDIPLNQGLLDAVQLTLPRGILNPTRGATPQESPAVVGGNVETSQRVVDVLLAVLDLAAASQGTMNNLLFGNERFGYYETICGGSGATATGAGAAAVQTHMTNTRLTDPEILETRYPIRLHRFEIRTGSGGNGAFAGGDGVIRELEFLAPLQLSLLSQRRGDYPPFGMHGGGPGMIGKNVLIHDGQETELAGQENRSVRPTDRLRIETPGGGGWGATS